MPVKSDEEQIREMEYHSLQKRLPDWQRIPRKIIELIIDQLILLHNIEKSHIVVRDELIDVIDHSRESYELNAEAKSIYDDYSFLIAPAYKAYEGYLIFIAEELGLPVQDYRAHIGGLYSWEESDTKRKKLIESIKGKLPKDGESVDRWRELGMVLRKYRHNPAHFSGDKIRTYEEAQGYILTIITTIDHMTRYLLAKGLLSADKMMYYKEE